MFPNLSSSFRTTIGREKWKELEFVFATLHAQYKSLLAWTFSCYWVKILSVDLYYNYTSIKSAVPNAKPLFLPLSSKQQKEPPSHSSKVVGGKE